ncbi:MAG: type III toxin-antitoxin system ToxN/AbiQ family toxin [Clostridia bacterium]|nr:type III toxin-antitoxin system ToxN/AbiQ family toxin [Clostridia bacterium]
MIKFYSVDENYIDTLKTVDKQVPNIKYDSNNKFFCGIVLKKKVLHGIIGIEERSGGNITNFV